MIKKFLFYFSCVIISITTLSCSINKTIKASNNIITTDIKIADFSKIILSGSPELIYTSGTPSLKIVAPDNMVEYVQVSINNGTLSVSIKNNNDINLFFNDTDDIKIYASSPNIDSATLNGSGDIVINSPITNENFNVTLNGSGDIEITHAITCKNDFKCVLRGSGDISMKSTTTANNASLDLFGSGDITAHTINSTMLNAKLNGSGDIEVKGVKTGDVNANLNGSGEMKLSNINANGVSSILRGSGDITLSGVAETTILEIYNSGSINASNLATTKGMTKVTGSGSIDCNVTNTLISAIQGSGSISYRGNPTITCETKEKPTRKY